MAIKVNDISAVNQVPEATKTVEGDGSFKFTLASAITDADLQAKVDELLSDITAQGNRLAEHIPSVAVKCVDIRRNTSGEGDLLDCY